MKRTKGPWEYIKSNGEDGPRVLSEKVTEFGNFYVASCNVDADAKLIAAAPELLEALKAMQCMCAAGCDRCAKQKSAIAKAEGRTE